MTRSHRPKRRQMLVLTVIVALVLTVTVVYLTGSSPFTDPGDAPQAAPAGQEDRGATPAEPPLPEPTRAIAIETLSWLEGDGRAVEDFVEVTAPLLAVSAGEGAGPACAEVTEALADTASPRVLSDATARIPDRLLAELHLATQDARVGVMQQCGLEAWEEMSEELEHARQSATLVDQRRRQLEEATR